MKPKELLFLAVAFFLGYFANTIVNMICGRPVIEGVGGRRPVQHITGAWRLKNRNPAEHF